MDRHTADQILAGHRDWYCPVCQGYLSVERLPASLYAIELVIEGEQDLEPVVVEASNEVAAREEGFREILVQFDRVTEYERGMMAAADRIRRRLQEQFPG